MELLFDSSMNWTDFETASTAFSSSDLHSAWAKILKRYDPQCLSFHDDQNFLNKLSHFLDEHGGKCKTHQAITMLSEWPKLSNLIHYHNHLELIALLLGYVGDSRYLLEAVAQIRDNEECRNREFFELLVDRIRWDYEDIAAGEADLVTEPWPADLEESSVITAESAL